MNDLINTQIAMLNSFNEKMSLVHEEYSWHRFIKSKHMPSEGIADLRLRLQKGKSPGDSFMTVAIHI